MRAAGFTCESFACLSCGGVVLSGRVQELRRTKIRKVVLAFERGTDEKAIAAKVGVSPPTISKWLTEEGYKRRKKGRVPLAMKARVRDLSLRGWSPSMIASMLQLDAGQVAEWADPKKNPILGGERDPLKVKGQRKQKKGKAKGLKRGRPRKEKLKKGEGWPPPKHKCRRHWTPTEKSYVLQLIETGIAPLAIYRRMRASRKRQIKIWRESGGSGLPPNFPPPKDRPPGPPGPALTPAEAAERKAETDAREAAAEERLRQLEAASARRQERIAELEAAAAEEERAIKLLEVEQKKLMIERREKAERLAQARAITKKKGELPTSKKRRVLEGSYEDEVLGLKPGRLVEPGKPGRPALPKPKHLGEYADNGRYFTVSREWADLDEATSDELALFADYLISKKFPAKVERSGDQPKAYFESTWPKKVEDRWNRAVEGGLTLLDKYSARKKVLKSKKMFSKGIANYLAKAYTAYADPSFPESKQRAAKEDLLDDWARLKKVDRLILIFDMGVSKPSGEPTSKGIERGRAAKILLEKESRAAAKKLEEKALASQKRKAIRDAERDEVDAILGGGRLALSEGDDEA